MPIPDFAIALTPHNSISRFFSTSSVMFFSIWDFRFSFPRGVVRPFTRLVLFLESLLVDIGRVCALVGISSLEAQVSLARISLDSVFSE